MMPDVSFLSLLAVAALAFLAPLALAASPLRRVPAVVVLILGGIALGPSGLGWIELDLPVQVVALLGLAFLLFLAGTEIKVHQLRGRRLRLALVAFVGSFALALIVGGLLAAAGFTGSPLLIAVILVATSLGVVIAVLKDAGETDGAFGQLVVAAASVADFGSIVLLSILFTPEGSDPLGTVAFVLLLAMLAVALAWAVLRTERSHRLTPLLVRLQDTTAQIRVRGAFVLLLGFTALAQGLGLELILGAFLAGAILTLVDPDHDRTHPQFRVKLEAIGYGVFVPVFFVATGLRFDVGALAASAESLVQVPIFVAGLLVVRGFPAIAFRREVGARRILAAGLLQATLLPIAPAQIGLELGLLSPATSAALITAGIVSVVVFPVVALGLLGDGRPAPEPTDAPAPNPSLPRKEIPA